MQLSLLAVAAATVMEVDEPAEAAGGAEAAAIVAMAAQGVAMSVGDMAPVIKMDEAPAGLQDAFEASSGKCRDMTFVYLTFVDPISWQMSRHDISLKPAEANVAKCHRHF